MKKALFIISFIIMLIGFVIWRKYEKQQKAQAIADSIIENLVKDEVYGEFPEKYFSKEQMKPFLGQLKENCDWENRDGKFVDFCSQMTVGGIDQTAFIYEYYLKCDSLRFILSVNMESEPELMGFNIEPLEKPNPLILFPEKQLKNRKMTDLSNVFKTTNNE